jgi:peptide/nickel transport system substrate-binding protein
VQFRFVTDANAAANSLTTGELDGTFEAPVSAISRLRSASDGKLFVGPSTQGVTLVPTGQGNSKNSKAMQGLSAAIDRVGIAKAVFDDTATPLATFASPEVSNYGQALYTADAAKYGVGAPDLEKAKSLVAESGATGATKLAIIAGDPASLRIANVLEDAGRQIGLPMQIDQVPPAQFVNLFFDPDARNKYDLLLQTTYSDFFDIAELFFLGFQPTSVQNVSGFNVPSVTAAINEGVQVEGDARAEQMIKANTGIMDALTAGIPVVRINERLFLNNRLTGAPARFPYQYHPWAAGIGAAG